MYLKRGNKTGGNYNSEEQPTSLAGSKMRSTDQRSPVRVDKDTGESYAEMFYLDLAQEAQRKKNKFQVKKIQRKTVGGARTMMNYKDNKENNRRIKDNDEL